MKYADYLIWKAHMEATYGKIIYAPQAKPNQSADYVALSRDLCPSKMNKKRTFASKRIDTILLGGFNETMLSAGEHFKGGCHD